MMKEEVIIETVEHLEGKESVVVRPDVHVKHLTVPEKDKCQKQDKIQVEAAEQILKPE
jgi:hypothetical protein